MCSTARQQSLRLLLSHCALLLVGAAEVRLVERLLFEDADQYDFVLGNMGGILAGEPSYPGFQHRLLGPACWWLLARLFRDGLVALRVLTGLLFVAANALTFEIARRARQSVETGFAWACGIGFAHLLLMYRLEYPWDGIDVLLFLSFGCLAGRAETGWRLGALCLVGAVNHETVLFIPLWYLLRATDRGRPSLERAAAMRIAGLALPALSIFIWSVRRALYVGKSTWAGDATKDSLPLVANSFHLTHNLKQVFVRNWGTDRIVISIALLAVIALLVSKLWDPKYRTAATWTLCVIASVACFGFVNETRLYLAPTAFWFGLLATNLGVQIRTAAD